MQEVYGIPLEKTNLVIQIEERFNLFNKLKIKIDQINFLVKTVFVISKSLLKL